MSALSTQEMQRVFEAHGSRGARDYGVHVRTTPSTTPNRKLANGQHPTMDWEAANAAHHHPFNDFMHGRLHLLTRAVREFAASFLFLFMGGLASAGGAQSHLVAVGYAVAHFITCDTHYGTSGNPLVVLFNHIVFASSPSKWYLGVAWMAQLSGALAGTALAHSLVPNGAVLQLAPAATSPSISTGQVVLVEVLFTFLYAYVHTVFYRTPEDGAAPVGNSMHSPLLLTAVVYGSLAVTSTTTNCSINLLRSLAPAIVLHNYSWVGTYVGGNLVGFTLGTLIPGFVYMASKMPQPKSND